MNTQRNIGNTIELILAEAESRKWQYGNGEREGQRTMNALHTVRPDLYSRIMAIDPPNRPDPFYQDEKLEEFWDWIVTALSEEENEQ